MTVQASRNSSFQPQESGALDAESSLWMLKNHEKRMRFAMYGCRLYENVKGAFDSLGAFFERLDILPEETLKVFTVKELKNDRGLWWFLASEFAAYSDNDFIDIPAHEIKETMTKSVRRRLAYIFHQNKKLFTDGTTPKTAGQEDRSITLRDIRRVKSGSEIKRLFSKKEFYPYLSLLSFTQKSWIRSQRLFEELITYDKEGELSEYIPKMSDIFLSRAIPKASECSIRLLPRELIARLDLSKLSDAHFYQLAVGNVGSLDKLSLSPEKIKEILHRMMTMILTRDVFSEKIKEKRRKGKFKKERVVIKREKPRLDPKDFVRLPASIFVTMDFVQMNAEQLFCLFHPKTLQVDEYFGDILEHIPGCPITIRSYSNPHLMTGISWAGGATYLLTQSSYEDLVKSHEKYNKSRLTLLSLEVYQAIRPKLDPEIVKLGDDIFQNASQ